MIYKCSNPAQWHPTLHTKQEHHHPPTAWRKVIAAQQGGGTAWWRTLPLCGLCHDEYHTLINLYVRLGKAPTGAELRTYSLYIKTLVAEAWEKRPEGRLPYTLHS